jgi:cell division protein FtsQ
LMPRVQRFVQTATQISSRYGRSVAALQSADLRHTDGYAIRISGVTALDAPVAIVKPLPPKPTKPKKP